MEKAKLSFKAIWCDQMKFGGYIRDPWWVNYKVQPFLFCKFAGLSKTLIAIVRSMDCALPAKSAHLIAWIFLHAIASFFFMLHDRKSEFWCCLAGEKMRCSVVLLSIQKTCHSRVKKISVVIPGSLCWKLMTHHLYLQKTIHHQN